MNQVVPGRMPIGLKAATYLVFGLLWLTGCLWLPLHLFLAQSNAFGALPNPWEAPLIRAHGWVAVAGVFLLGWLAAAHMADQWWQLRRRPSGPVLAALGALLVLSGYALYYTTDRWHGAASLIHEILGVSGIGLGLLHWLRVHRR